MFTYNSEGFKVVLGGLLALQRHREQAIDSEIIKILLNFFTDACTGSM